MFTANYGRSQLIYNATLSYSHELWVMTKRMIVVTSSQILFFSLGVWDSGTRSFEIRRELEVEHLCVNRKFLRWFRHLINVPPGCLPLELVIQTHQTGRRSEPQSPGGMPHLTRQPLMEELEDMAGKKDNSVAFLRLLPPQPGLG